MNADEITKLLTTAIIGILVVVAVFIPMIDGFTVERRNNDLGMMASVEVSDPITLDLDATNSTWSVNGVVQNEMDVEGLRTKMFLMADSINIYADYTPSGTIDRAFLTYKVESGIGYATTITSASITLANNSYSIEYIKSDNSMANATGTYEWAYYGNNDGDYRVVSSARNNNPTVFFSSPNDVKYSYYSWSTGGWLSGTGTDAVYNGDPITAVMNYEQIGEGVYSATDNVTTGDRFIIATVSHDDASVDLYPLAFVVPYEVSGDIQGYSAPLKIMVSLLPIFALIGLVIGLIRAIKVRI